jgi:hypothetical protein
MPRLCPYCHKLGISTWATLWSAAGPVECSNCHQVSRRKRDGSLYVGFLVPLVALLGVFVLHLSDTIVGELLLITAMVVTYFHYRGAKFERLDLDAPPPRETS